MTSVFCILMFMFFCVLSFTVLVKPIVEVVFGLF